MTKYRFSALARLMAICLAALMPLSYSGPTSAEDEGLTFEQAQTRTAFARRQMEAKRSELERAEHDEEAALQSLDELKKRYEEAQKQADMATKARQGLEQEYAEAQRRWSEESQRLKRIHQRHRSNSRSR